MDAGYSIILRSENNKLSLFLLGTVLFGIYCFVFGQSGIMERMRLEKEKESLVLEISYLERDNERLEYLYNEYARKPHGELSETYPLSEVKYMPEGLITHAWMEIYADTVTIGINKGKAFSIVIQNQEVAESFKVYARLLWEIAHK